MARWPSTAMATSAPPPTAATSSAAVSTAAEYGGDSCAAAMSGRMAAEPEGVNPTATPVAAPPQALRRPGGGEGEAHLQGDMRHKSSGTPSVHQLAT
jgi:hypothetical protein